MYKVQYKKTFAKSLEKFIKDSDLNSAEAENAIKTIIENPKNLPSKMLKGNMLGFINFSFSHNPEMRIIYKFYDCSCLAKTDSTKICRFEDREETDDATDLQPKLLTADEIDKLNQIEAQHNTSEVNLENTEFATDTGVEQRIPNIHCLGLIDFILIATREECNNIYKKPKKYWDKQSRE
jgi:mRNA-degrading endonuclease YafQ of YafQ-DinJ toxin-antitoxin module